MSGESGGIDPVARLADEFLERYRRGERPSLAEYAGRHPELATRIRELFPMLVTMEQAGADSEASGGDPHARPAGLGTGPARQQIGDYRLLREIGSGGMGIVYEAEQLSLGRHVAVKILPPHVAGDERLMGRFRQEARAAARLHHTNIVPVYDIGQEGDFCYYAMQLIHGPSLDEILHEIRRLRADSEGTARPAPARAVARSLVTGQFADDGSPADHSSALAPTVVQRESERSSDDRFEVDSPAAGPQSTARLGAEETQASPVPPPQPTDSDLIGSDRQFYFRSVARIGIQVSDALAHAHREGIIHRDIKPSNLLLDARGQVWITDFGLAKTEDDGLTRTGDVLGTLRYMPPERFRGWSDPRSDIYSLGVTLYEMLALRPPFDEADRLRLIQEITHGSPPRLRRLDRRIPADLETIVFKAIDREPVQRYQSAAELRDDLQRFLDNRPIAARRASRREQAWRWCRRNPALAGLGALVAVLLLLLATGATAAAFHFRRVADEREAAHRLAVQREQEAQRNFQLAVEAVDRYLMRVSDDPRLKAHGLETLRRDLLETAREFYEELTRRETDDPRLEAERGRAYQRLGTVSQELGDYDAAADFYEESARIYEQLSRRSSERAPYRRAANGARSRLAALWVERGEFERAEGIFRSVLEDRQSLAQQHPQNVGDQVDLVTTQHALGFVARELGRTEQAETLLRAAVRQMENYSRAHPDVPSYRTQQALAHNNLGLMYKNLGRVAEAERELNAAVALYRQLVASGAGEPEYGWDLARALMNRGLLHEAVRQFKRAESDHTEAVAIQERLVRAHPDVPAYGVGLGGSYCNLGLLYRKQNEPEKALPWYERAAETLRSAVERIPQDARAVKFLRNAYWGQALALASLNRFDPSDAAFRQAVELAERLVRIEPKAAVFRADRIAILRGRGLLLNDYGDALLKAKDYKSAEQVLQTALHVREEVARAAPDVISDQVRLSNAYHDLGRLDRARAQSEAAIAWYTQSVEFLLPFAEADDVSPSILHALRDSYHGRGDLLKQLGRYQEAARDFEAAIITAERLRTQRPDDAGDRSVLTHLYEAQGRVYEQLNQPEQSRTAGQKAEAMRQGAESTPATADDAAVPPGTAQP